jgi:pimeloyl-ACP methyl ester carboxylesterase
MMRPHLILVPGLACTADLWRDQAADLAEAATIDIPDATLRHDTIAAMANAILAGAPDQFALAGLSMGGYVALEMVRQAPSRITVLALLDTSARSDTPEQTTRRLALIDLAQANGMKSVIDELLPWMICPDRLGQSDLTARLIAMAEQVGVSVFLRQQQAIIHRIDSRPGLAAITCPTLVACGDTDRITPPEWSAEIAAAIPAASLTSIPACGHMSSMECPGAVTDLLRKILAASVSSSSPRLGRGSRQK